MASPPRLPFVDVVLQHAAPRVASVGEVLNLISECLDVSVLLPLPRAAASRSPQLFDRVYSRVLGEDHAVEPALRGHWLSKSMEAALKNNDLPMAQKIHELHPEPLAVWPLQLALTHGTLETVQWVVEHRSDRICCSPGIENLCSACLVPCIESMGIQDFGRVIEWLTTKGPVRLSKPLNKADWMLLGRKKHQSIDLVRWLDDKEYLTLKQIERLLKEAVFYDAPNLEVISYLASRTSPTERRRRVSVPDGVMRKMGGVAETFFSTSAWIRDKLVLTRQLRAATHPTPDLQLLSNKEMIGKEILAQLVENAERRGDIKTLEAITGSKPEAGEPTRPSTWKTDQEAVEALTLIFDRGHPLDILSTSRILAERGFVQALQSLENNWQLYNGWYQWILDITSTNGHLNVVEWLHDKTMMQYRYGQAILFAARNGHLAVLQYLHDIGAITDTNEVMLEAALGGHLEVLSWMYDNSNEPCAHCLVKSILRINSDRPIPARYPLLHTMAWLESRLPIHPTCTRTWVRTPFETLVKDVAKSGDVDLLARLHRHQQRELPQYLLRQMEQLGHSTALVSGVTHG